VSGPRQHYEPADDNIVIEKICPYVLGESTCSLIVGSSMAAYNLLQQNRYLQQKIELLRNEYERQSRRI